MSRRTVLVIDDDVVLRKSVEQVLLDEYNVLTAGDTHEAMLLLMEMQQRVDLILLDVMMPGFDGFSTLLLLKDDDKTRSIPVLMLSAVGKKEKIISAFRGGASGYMLKPFDENLLKRKISEILNGKC